ncbi:MAG: agmatine deiminase family protein, partial [Clostridia bacterium]|nr:agmatine deiminase family protein [Clostridia bacterium]
QPARRVFAELIRTISQGEKVYLAVSPRGRASAEKLLAEQIANKSVELWEVETDDCWARDIGPTFVKCGKQVRGVDWEFNAWGGEFDGLYPHWEKDDAFASFACKKLGLKCYSARPFILEGGSIHSNGKGTVITTAECLLSEGRNIKMFKFQIEDNLREYLGAKKVVWLPYGVYGDETNGHVDNVCAFVDENTVVLGWTEQDKYRKRLCEENLEALQAAGINVIKIPFPEKPVMYTMHDLGGLVYEEGEIERNIGEPLAASYVNFYVCNAAVLVPVFGDNNDKVALEILSKAFPQKKIVPVFARELLLGGGNIHCLTQQIPK